METEHPAGQVLDAYGNWIASLAPWTHFVTLTHRRPPDELGLAVIAKRGQRGRSVWSRVGVARHRRMVREWFYDDVRVLDPSARWWGEMEFHVSGQPHEHGMLSLAPRAPDLRMRQLWFERAGYAKWLEVDARGAIAPAAYVSKYAQKAVSREPSVWGFGLIARPSHSLTLDVR